MIICICRGKSDRDVNKAIEQGATSVRDLARCGIGDECGSCHSSLRAMLARAAAAEAAAAMPVPHPCPACGSAAASAAASA